MTIAWDITCTKRLVISTYSKLCTNHLSDISKVENFRPCINRVTWGNGYCVAVFRKNLPSFIGNITVKYTWCGLIIKQRSISLVLVPNPLMDEPTIYKPQSTTNQMKLKWADTSNFQISQLLYMNLFRKQFWIKQSEERLLIY